MQDTQKRRLAEILEQEMANMNTMAVGYMEGSASVSEIERGLLKAAILLCLKLLKYILVVKSQQDLSEQIDLRPAEVVRPSGRRTRRYMSLFGLLEFERQSYHSDQRGMLYPLDEHMSIPAIQMSYNIQEVLGQGASEVSFRESTCVLTTLLGLPLRGVDSERNADRLGGRVDAFYEQQAVERPSEEQCVCATFDGKGVPKVKKADKDPAPPSSRLNRGQKRGVKEMATVVVTSFFTPKVRNKSSIIDSLMNRQGPTAPPDNGERSNDNRWQEGIHRRAFLGKQEEAVKYGLRRVKEQITSPSQRLVVPIDAGIGLEEKILKYVKEYGLENHFDGIILDIVHASEYVWVCANAVLGEKSKIRSAWVTAMLEDLLDSKTEKVINDLKAVADKSNLSQVKRDKIRKAATYFSNHAHKMDYKTYLAKGYPISSALVESNCKHLIKDRMEGSGMRWSDQGAQHMIDLRAVKLNGDLIQFMDFVAQTDKKITQLKAA